MAGHATSRADAYEVLNPDTVRAYLAARPQLARRVDVDTLTVREVGDGNLNLVFVCHDAQGRGVCVKQALPFVRLVGEAWPLTPTRAEAEASAYLAAREVTAELVPELYAFDADRHILVLEDLSSWTVWRTALNAGRMSPGAPEQMGRYVARMAFATSPFALAGPELRRRAAQAANPELCEITEALVFTEPYVDHPNNSFDPALAPDVAVLRADAALRVEVERLKHRFMTVQEALIHGDLHTGSVMVAAASAGAAAGAEVPAKAFDPEFACYGPVAFDLGALFANYVLASARAEALERPPAFRAWVAELPLRTWTAFARELERCWEPAPGRPPAQLTAAFRDAWLGRVLRDAIGFGACKAIRRIVGLAKASDVETLPADLRVVAARATLARARAWLHEAPSATDPVRLLALGASSPRTDFPSSAVSDTTTQRERERE